MSPPSVSDRRRLRRARPLAWAVSGEHSVAASWASNGKDFLWEHCVMKKRRVAGQIQHLTRHLYEQTIAWTQARHSRLGR